MKGLHNKVRKKDHDERSRTYTMIKGSLEIFTHIYNLTISYMILDLSYFTYLEIISAQEFSKECIKSTKKKKAV